MLLLFTSSEVVDGEAMIQLSDFVERSFNQILSDLIATLDDVGEEDKEQREDWLYNELMMFLTDLQGYMQSKLTWNLMAMLHTP